jgi:hypothetical protein
LVKICFVNLKIDSRKDVVGDYAQHGGEGGKDADVYIRVVFEGARDRNGEHNDVVIEEKLRDGNSNKPKEVYQIYVKGATQNGGLHFAGSVVSRWLQERNSVKIEPLVPSTPKPMEVTERSFLIFFNVNSTTLQRGVSNMDNLQEIANRLIANPKAIAVISVNGAFSRPTNLTERQEGSATRTTPSPILGGLSIDQFLTGRLLTIIRMLTSIFRIPPNQIIGKMGNPFSGNTNVNVRFVK